MKNIEKGKKRLINNILNNSLFNNRLIKKGSFIITSLVLLFNITTLPSQAYYSASSSSTIISGSNVSSSTQSIGIGTSASNNQNSNDAYSSWWDYYRKNSLPNFGYCPKPGGKKIAKYKEGWHWIVGNSVLQWGKDVVFNKGNDNVTQCFCPKPTTVPDYVPTYTQGVQTNWLKASNISSKFQDKLLNKGWVKVDNGADFGLAAEPYLTKNTSFWCNRPYRSCFD